jgi:ABC-type protease/lipase transport system fused ATPase/permease subunit
MSWLNIAIIVIFIVHPLLVITIIAAILTLSGTPCI